MKLITQISIKHKLACAIILASGLILSAQAGAASQCRGLESAACSANTSCGWIQGYERKDGIKVKSFCRTKAKKVVKKTK